MPRYNQTLESLLKKYNLHLTSLFRVYDRFVLYKHHFVLQILQRCEDLSWLPRSRDVLQVEAQTTKIRNLMSNWQV